ncbi:hypothetical protein HBH53_137590 [Parastagonospora nodorum]|nr:hypothetical protein HBH53_137590 [Parastagonospora nodorum]KAH4267258.1 hypothetical protein HBI03_066010 [Parastagonospora nodorum]KAH4273266.1 hypothetical protein HBI04_135830 [Parastagonospora nodorum]KAH4988931.1 hypothetical protein HBI76_081860 [Parastagonospora nodorum]
MRNVCTNPSACGQKPIELSIAAHLLIKSHNHFSVSRSLLPLSSHRDVFEISRPHTVLECSTYSYLPHTAAHTLMDSQTIDLDTIFNDHRCVDAPSKRIPMSVMRRGVEAHCPVCRFISACIDWAVLDFMAYRDADYIHLEPGGVLRILNEQAQSLCCLEPFRPNTSTDYESTDHTGATARILPGTTSSAQTFATIEAWLMKCDLKHVKCAEQSSRTAGNPPKGIRLLEIKRDTLLLIEHVQDLPSTKYACLSHCWGSGEGVVKTFAKNLQAHLSIGVELDSLPLTFKDAVDTCRRLCIDYLWIDSLCIIQDSDEDWRFQAALMADVYENARVTIAAAAAHDPGKGCFQKTHRSCLGQPLPEYPGVCIRCMPERPSESATQWPLQLRGWVFQELCLSPRIIHFGTQEVEWQCRSTYERESRPNLKPYNFPWIVYSPDFFRTPVAKLLHEWHATVTAYSWRALTFPKDRLPAIAAMATRMQECRPRDRYLAGLWQSSLCFDLMWYTNDQPGGTCDPATIEIMIAQRIEDYSSSDRIGVPSWSWASTPRGVRWWYNATFEMLSNAEVLDISYSIRGPEVSGEIQNAAITLRAPLISLEGIRCADHTITCGSQSSQLSFALNEPQAVAAEHLVYDKFYWDTHGSEKGYPAQQELFFLVIVVNTYPGRCGMEAIVLGQTQQLNTFCRVGTVDLRLKDCWLEMCAWEREGREVWDYPEDRQQVYQKTLISMLENTETRIITLV